MAKTKPKLTNLPSKKYGKKSGKGRDNYPPKTKSSATPLK